MAIQTSFLFVLCLSALVFCSSVQHIEKRTSRTSPPSGCLTVGSGYTYTTISDALSNLSSSTGEACIFIAAGNYDEQLTIDYANNLTIYGETTDTETYKSNNVTISNTISSSEAGSLDASSTLNVVSDYFKMYNINVKNGYGSGAQAVALTANANYLGFYGCQFSGYQDTLYAKAGYQYYSKSLVLGADDYIFGAASAWFGDCDIESNGGGSITANSRDSESDPSWYVFDNCNVKAASGYDDTESVYLGRPWRAYARVMYQYCTLSDIINPQGWTTLAANATPLFYEYNNTGAGSDTSAREYETSASSSVAQATVLGDNYSAWIDSTN